MSMEKTVSIPCGELILEGSYAPAVGEKAVVVTHPHPLYGGDMHNPVVTTVAQTYGREGYGALRFNFRGVGNSQGNYDNGEGEKDDLLAAVRWLFEKGATGVVLAGYSFGAWVISRLDTLPDRVTNIVLVSPPVAMMAFKPSPALAHVTGIITGDSDDIAPPADISALMAGMKLKARMETIPGCDHFYGGRLPDLASRIRQFL